MDLRQAIYSCILQVYHRLMGNRKALRAENRGELSLNFPANTLLVQFNIAIGVCELSGIFFNWGLTAIIIEIAPVG